MAKMFTQEGMKEAIWASINAYRSHCANANDMDEITDDFVSRLAKDNIAEKENLVGMFSKHPLWNAEKGAVIVPNVVLPVIPQWNRIREAMWDLVHHRYDEIRRDDCEKGRAIWRVIEKVLRAIPEEEGIDALNEIAPRVWHPGKKMSKILTGFMKAINVWDDKNRTQQQIFAKVANEFRGEVRETVYVSPAAPYLLTVSNPHSDLRGSAMQSCHSFDNKEHSYRTGNSGYARDTTTFVLFTAANESDDALYTRKTYRQLFGYEVGNGVLLQSRMYKTSVRLGESGSYGGTHGEQSETKPFRKLVEDIICTCEGTENLWKAFPYVGNDYGVEIYEGNGFGGYADWPCSENGIFAAIQSQKFRERTWHNFSMGTYGLCWRCGEEVSSEIFCYDCNGETCACCGEHIHRGNEYEVVNRWGDTVYVCEYCRDEYYTLCGVCEQYHPNSEMESAIDSYGDSIAICENCRSNGDYNDCSHCGTLTHNDALYPVHDYDGSEIYVCEDCRDRCYSECEGCLEYYPDDEIEDGLCPDCRSGGSDDVCENCGQTLEDGRCPDCDREDDDEEMA